MGELLRPEKLFTSPLKSHKCVHFGSKEIRESCKGVISYAV